MVLKNESLNELTKKVNKSEDLWLKFNVFPTDIINAFMTTFDSI